MTHVEPLIVLGTHGHGHHGCPSPREVGNEDQGRFWSQPEGQPSARFSPLETPSNTTARGPWEASRDDWSRLRSQQSLLSLSEAE